MKIKGLTINWKTVIGMGAEKETSKVYEHQPGLFATYTMFSLSHLFLTSVRQNC